MKFLNKMERKFGRYAIRNLSFYIIITYVIGYVIELAAPNLFLYMTLEPALILRGQIWRLVSWVLIPPESLGLFTIIMLMLYYSLGNSLERAWGTFRYNVYIFMGMFASLVGAFILYFCGVRQLGAAFSTYYVNVSIFLAYAAIYPEDRVYLYFLVPIKMKWMGLLYGVITIYGFINSGWAGRTVILSSLANFLIFLLMNRNIRRISPKELRRRQRFHKQIQRSAPPEGITKHKCAICGRTELDGDDLEFRFCSKCDGNYEYCQDHLFSHTHIKRH